MKRSITLAVAAAGITLALAGCQTGIDSETAAQVAAVPGYSSVFPLADGTQSVSVLNATLDYPGVEGYKAGEEAPITLTVVNTTTQPVRVVLKSAGSGDVTAEGGILTLEPGKSATLKGEVKLTEALQSGEFARVDVEFVGLKTFEAQIPVKTPNSPAPRVPQEVTGGTEGEGH